MHLIQTSPQPFRDSKNRSENIPHTHTGIKQCFPIVYLITALRNTEIRTVTNHMTAGIIAIYHSAVITVPLFNYYNALQFP